MTRFDIANGIAAVAALGFAFGVPKPQVKAATGLYLFVVFNWWFYVASNEPNHPLALLWAAGYRLTYDSVWTWIDAATAILAGVAGLATRQWWFAAVYFLSLSQVAFHIAYWDLALVPEWAYYPSLNVLFWGILSAVLFAGGAGVKDRIARHGRDLWRAYRVRIAEGGF
jgi:hypothetical protein